MSRDQRQAHLARAKQLLYEQMAKHPDPGVRAMNDALDIADDHPAVIQIAAVLADPRRRP